MRLRDANWVRMRVKKLLNYNYSSSPMIRYLTAIIDENGDFKFVSMCRFPRDEEYKTFLSYNIAVYQMVVTDNLGYWWASDNMSVFWNPGNNYSNYNNCNNNWAYSLGNLYSPCIDSFR